MLISELFYSIQGEGKRTGFPSFFIRTNYCNLRCKFRSGNLCDSAYTSWEPQSNDNIGEMSVDDIIKVYSRYNCNNVVITGGEPAIQEEELNILCKKIKLANPGIHITLETNGTKAGDFVKLIDLASISPKLKSSVPYSTKFEKTHEKIRINLDTLKLYHKKYSEELFDIQWKFVINDESDMEEIFALQNIIGFSSGNVFLMPEGISKEEIELRRMQIINLCLKYNFNYSGRLHISIWGNERGR
ncbi:MAG: 7-carboxy-7-deazaguanine synthase QueE [Ignavibacteria bacterium]|nr:7-carboxy-7-deazaguanine synthase QueE [Ignavibacteria bacterium]